MKKVVRRSWDAIPMPDTMIARVNALGQGQPNDIELLDHKKRPIGELYIKVVDSGKTEASQIELIEQETDINPISAGTETLPELVEHQDIPTIEIEKDMSITKEDGILEALEQRIDPDVPSLAEG